MADHPPPTEQRPQDWLDALADADADLAAGRTAPWPEARARLLGILDDSAAEPTDRRA